MPFEWLNDPRLRGNWSPRPSEYLEHLGGDSSLIVPPFVSLVPQGVLVLGWGSVGSALSDTGSVINVYNGKKIFYLIELHCVASC